MSPQPTSLNLGLGGAWLAEHTLRSVGAGIALFDSEARLTQLDARARTLLALAETEEIGCGLDHPRWAAIHLDATPLDADSDPVRAVLADPTKAIADVIGILDEHGETRWLAVTALQVSAPDGASSGALVSFVEVTGVVRDRAAVDRAELLGRAAFDHAITPLCVVDERGLIVEWNRGFALRIDRPDYEILQTPIDRWVHGAVEAMERSVGVESDDPPIAAWADGRDVAVRMWPYESGGGGRWMLELSARTS